mmetsp:Transcript_168523/g.541618  ORF Transcript_168523/g.541618 Transcript_168523/m.541618 type:complete len:243 (-) Transcript_168523:120-848(-)
MLAVEEADRPAALSTHLFDSVLATFPVQGEEKTSGAAVELIVQVEDNGQLRPTVAIHVADDAVAICGETAPRPTSVCVQTENVLRVVLVQTPVGIQPAHFTTLGFRWEVRFTPLEQRVAEDWIGKPHAILIVPDVASQGHRRILREAHCLAQLHQLVTLARRENVPDHEAPRYTISLYARRRLPLRLLIKNDGARHRCEYRQILSLGTTYQGHHSKVLAFGITWKLRVLQDAGQGRVLRRVE